MDMEPVRHVGEAPRNMDAYNEVVTALAVAIYAFVGEQSFRMNLLMQDHEFLLSKLFQHADKVYADYQKEMYNSEKWKKWFISWCEKNPTKTEESLSISNKLAWVKGEQIEDPFWISQSATRSPAPEPKQYSICAFFDRYSKMFKGMEVLGLVESFNSKIGPNNVKWTFYKFKEDKIGFLKEQAFINILCEE